MQQPPDLYRDPNIRLTCIVEGLQVDLDEATALGIIITELVNNAYIHAFPDRTGEISVVLRVGPGGASILVSDNGVGFVEVETKRRGMGLVRRLVRQVGATLTHQLSPGSGWTVAFRGASAAQTAVP